MKSKLEVVSMDKLQPKIVRTVHSLKGIGIYVSLSKNEKRMKKILSRGKTGTKNLFFIDCVDSENVNRDVLQIPPTKLDDLSFAIKSFMKEIKEKKFLVIDSLSVLLIYNNKNQVASFVRKIIEYASREDVEVIAFSPKTKGEELLGKIFSFFDEVKGK